MPRHTQTYSSMNLRGLVEAADIAEREEQQVLQRPDVTLPREKSEDETNPLFARLKREGHLEKLTSYAESELLDIARAMRPYFAQARKRGPRPSVAEVDALILLLLFYR